MTVTSENKRNQYTCTGVVIYGYTFRILNKEHLLVIYTTILGVETTLTLDAGTAGYTVSGVGDAGGGNVTTTDTYTSGTLTIIRDVPLTQLTDYVENDIFPSTSHENAIDKLTMIIQGVSERWNRMLALAKSSAYSDLTLPDPEDLKILQWKTDLSGLMNVSPYDLGDLTVTDFGKTLLDDVDAVEARATLGVYFDSIQNYDNDLATAVSEIGATKKTLLVDATTESVTSNLEVPETLELYVTRAGLITIDNCILTINKLSIATGLYKIFNCINGGSVTFGSGSIPCDYPEWWDIDGTADEVEINKAIIAAVNIKTVKLQAKQYYTANSVLLNQPGVGLVCDGDYALIRTSSGYDAIVVTAEYPVCRNIKAYTTFSPNTRYGWWFQDGAKHGTYYGCSAIGFKRPWMFHSSTATGIGYNDFYSAVSYGGECGIFGSLEGEGWVNENHWFGGFVTASSVSGSKCVSMVGNQNCFFGVCLQGGHKDTAAILELGLNYYTGCRFEVEGPVFRIANGSTSFEICSRISNNYYSGSCRHPLYVLESGKVKINEERFQGLIESGTPATDVVDAESLVDQKVLNISDTAEFYVGDAIRINAGGDRDEWGGVASIQAGISLTLHDDLLYTHTGVQADAVITRGLRYGINFRDANKLDFWTYGVLVLQIASDGAAKLKGALSASTEPIH